VALVAGGRWHQLLEQPHHMEMLWNLHMVEERR
jgi:hypothetical protein